LLSGLRTGITGTLYIYGKATFVVFISGDTPPEYILGVKDWGVYVGWGRLVAAAGLIGIPFQHRAMRDLHPAHLDAVIQSEARYAKL